MISPDERREVARKLRDDLPVARNIKEGYVAIMQTIGVRPCLLMVEGQSGDRFDVTAYEEGAAKLADLIDHPTFRATCKGSYTAGHDYTRWQCGRCGAYTFSPHEWVAPRYCQHCGERLVTDDAQ